MRDEDITKLMHDVYKSGVLGMEAKPSQRHGPRPSALAIGLRMRSLGWRTAENVRLWH
jgi:hypothetical protein